MKWKCLFSSQNTDNYDFFIELLHEIQNTAYICTHIIYTPWERGKIERKRRTEQAKWHRSLQSSVNFLKTIFTLHLPNESTHTKYISYSDRESIEGKKNEKNSQILYFMQCTAIQYIHILTSVLFIYEQFKSQCAEKQDNPNVKNTQFSKHSIFPIEFCSICQLICYSESKMELHVNRNIFTESNIVTILHNGQQKLANKLSNRFSYRYIRHA